MTLKSKLLKGSFVLASLVALNAPMAMAEDAMLKDGEYTAVSNIDEHGWALKHTIVVKDGKITESKMDYVNDKGEMKSENAQYNDKMKEVAGISGKDAMMKLDEALVATQGDKIEVVTGATHTSETFMISSKALIEAAKEGKTEEINIDTLPLVDGEYSLETPADERGWMHTFTIVAKDGKVSESKYDMKNDKGEMKSESKEYNDMMKEKSGVSFAEAVKSLNEQLVKDQKIEVVTGATSTTKAFETYAKQLIKAAREGKTDVIKAELISE